MAAKERLVIKSNCQRYEGWKSVRVLHSLEMGACEISLEVAEWPDDIGLYLEDEIEAFVADAQGKLVRVFGGTSRESKAAGAQRTAA